MKREVERKTMAAFLKGIDARTVTGVTAVSGNVDDGGDRIIFGAFAKTISESSKRFRHLWQHGADGWDYGVTPPIAAIDSIAEVGRDALPLEVQTAYPLATGGLEVRRTYLPTLRGDEILACYQAGIPLEMSIGFETVIRKTVEDSERVSMNHWRDLIEVKLFDTSDVNWGMNSATVGAKSTARRVELITERLRLLKSEDLVEVDEPLLLEFRAACAELSLPRKAESRAEPLKRVSLTPALSRLREIEVALALA